MSEYRKIYGSEELQCPFCREYGETGPVDDYNDDWGYDKTCSICGEEYVAVARLSVAFDCVSREEFLRDKVASFGRGVEKLERRVATCVDVAEQERARKSLELTRAGMEKHQALLDAHLAARARGTKDEEQEELTTESTEGHG